MTASRLAVRYLEMHPLPGALAEIRLFEDMENLPPGAEFEVPAAGIILGRLQGVDVWIVSPYVKRKHARIWPTGDGVTLTLEDLESTNETFVNGVPTRKALLHPGDRFAIAGLYNFEVVRREDRERKDEEP